MQNKRIVLFAYYWPPAGGPGVQRWLKLTKYLANWGWKITVICPENPTAAGFDAELIKDVHPGIEIIKTQTFEPFEFYNKLKGGKSSGVGGIGIQESRGKIQKTALWIRANLFVPDARKGWVKFAIKAFEKWVKTNGTPQYIITTGPPHSIHLAGIELKKKHKLKWIADFRDPWTTVFYNEFLPRTNFTKKRDLELETLVLRTADITTTISPGLKDELIDRANQLEIIWNGFDENDIPEMFNGTTEKFSMSYVGNFKPNQNVPTLWKALKELSEEIPTFSKDLEIIFAGNVSDIILNDLKKLGLFNNLKQKGYISHSEATQLMTTSCLLIFVIPQTERNHLILTGKIFEYLASGSQMLSIGPPQGNASEIIKSSSRSPMLDYQNLNEIKSQVYQSYLSWKENSQKAEKLDSESIQNFTRKAQAEKLEKILLA